MDQNKKSVLHALINLFFSDPKKAKVTPSYGKVMLYFKEIGGTTMTDYMENGQKVTGDYC